MILRRLGRSLMPYALRRLAGMILHKFNRFIYERKNSHSAIDMWKLRAKQYGPRAVLNIGHTNEEIGYVTEMQKEKIFPCLKQELTGLEKTILDLGCGPGRFTIELSEAIQGKVIGVDVVQDFLGMAPKHEYIEYRLMENGVIPVSDNSIDVVWICLVLGGITDDKELFSIVYEVNRVLKNDGLIALIENTTDGVGGEYWKFRSVEFYESLFSFVNMVRYPDYYDLGERISIMMGRKDV